MSPVMKDSKTASQEHVELDVGGETSEISETAKNTDMTPSEDVKKKQRKRTVSFGGKDEMRMYTPARNSPTNLIVPQPDASWVTDASGPAALNRIIREKSSDAQLVIVNLPDPDSLVMANPAAYARYVEHIVRGLPRVVYVHGTGREVYMSAR